MGRPGLENKFEVPNRTIRFIFVSAPIILAFLIGNALAQEYRVTELPSGTTPRDINNQGVIVGSYYDQVAHKGMAFKWNGAFQKFEPTGAAESAAVAVNDAGTIVGGFRVQLDFGSAYRFFVQDRNGQFTVIPEPAGCRINSINTMNNLGHMGGQVTKGYGENSDRAYLWISPNQGIDLNDLLPPNSGWNLYQLVRLNDNGQMLGFGRYNGTFGLFLAKLVNNQLTPTQIGASFGLGHCNPGLNNAASIAGSSDKFSADSMSRAFFQKLGFPPQNLGVYPGGAHSGACDLNTCEQVVGYSDVPQKGYQSFVWTKQAGLKLLSGVSALRSYANIGMPVMINDRGQIVVQYTNVNNPVDTKGLLLNPLVPATCLLTPVPSPISVPTSVPVAD